MSKNFCVNCKEPLDNDARFCEGCGAQVVQQTPPIQPQAPQYQPLMQQTAQPTADAPGQKLLKIVGILYIVFASINILLSMISLSALLTMDYWLGSFGGEAMHGSWIFYYTAPVFISFFALFIGIMGVANCKNKQKASMLQGLGIIGIAIYVLFYASTAAMGVYAYLGELGTAMLILLPIDFILPALYIVGARKNMR